jgi:hypothetical protein
MASVALKLRIALKAFYSPLPPPSSNFFDRKTVVTVPHSTLSVFEREGGAGVRVGGSRTINFFKQLKMKSKLEFLRQCYF